jgi:glutamine amidotransferase
MTVPIAIADYGSANFGSVIGSFDAVGVLATIARTPEAITEARLVVLPGVGHAGAAMSNLSEGWLRGALEERHAAGRPILGICLGAQLMFEHLEESGSEGLRWIPGEVRRLPERIGHNTGWAPVDHTQLLASGLGRSLTPRSTFYFNHGFHLPVGSTRTEVTLADDPSIAAIVRQDHLTGVQFHPEKSQAPGRYFLRNLLEDRHGV